MGSAETDGTRGKYRRDYRSTAPMLPVHTSCTAVPSGRGETRKKTIVNGGAVDAGDDEDIIIL